MPLGAHPGNSGGKKGRSGRKPDAFKRFLARLRENPKLYEALERVVTDPNSRGFASALKVLVQYDDEKPVQKHAVVGPLEVQVKFVREGPRRPGP